MTHFNPLITFFILFIFDDLHIDLHNSISLNGNSSKFKKKNNHFTQLQLTTSIVNERFKACYDYQEVELEKKVSQDQLIIPMLIV